MERTLDYGTTRLRYTLQFAERKSLGVRVSPDGSVTVTAPPGTPDDKIEERLLTKAAWIRRQREFFLSFEPRRAPRRYVSGETHLYLGKQYRLKVHPVADPAETDVRLLRGYFHVRTPAPANSARIEAQLRGWYERQADRRFAALLERRLPAARRYYAGPVRLRARWLANRWGSCRRSGVITLNYELIKAPVDCIEYVIVHELCHLAEFNHGPRFFALLEREWPGWRGVKERLEGLLA